MKAPLSVLVFFDRRSNEWIAHYLEEDIVAENKTPARALLDLWDLIEADRVIQASEESVVRSEAPAMLWDAFQTAQPFTHSHCVPRFILDQFDAMNIRECPDPTPEVENVG